MEEKNRLAELLFPNVQKSPEDYLTEIYPPRAVKEGAVVSRFAPSPTGFLHIGNVVAALIAERGTHSSGGPFILRIEDTDKKREVEGGLAAIVDGLSSLNIAYDEGPDGKGNETGAYGPYIQSRRAHLYHAFCKPMVLKGTAYPCFCTEDELAAIREGQEKQNLTPGYWGEHARCRDKSCDEIEALVKSGAPFVMRLRSPGKPGGRVKFRDLVRGEIEMEENFADVVLLKSDGIPTYHLAHIIDDILMRVTHVIRGEEWISSVPIHLQLYYVLGYKLPKFVHVSVLMKEDGGGKRKLSKRKDPEAALSYFVQEGYPAAAVVEYLMTIINSNFEDWRRQNKTASYKDFPFQFGKMSQSGALFDLQKLQSVSSDVISRMTAEEVYAQSLVWAEQYDPALHQALAADKDFARQLFAIDRGGAKPRKDIAKWDQVKQYVAYFYDDLFAPQADLPENLTAQAAKEIAQAYLPLFDATDDKDAWFAKIRALAQQLGYAPDVKQYKETPGVFRGHVGDVSTAIRVAITGRRNTPDLHGIMALLGQQRCTARIEVFLNL